MNAQTPEIEPNDNFETANALGEANISAQITDGESDFYQIDANTTDALSLEVINISGNDANVALRLYDSNRDTLNTDDTNRAQDLSITRKLPETGTYYVEVDGTFSQTTANYTLDVDRVTPNENDQFAPNDGFNSAAAIPEGFNDARIVGGESDFYQIDANATDALSLEVININGNDANVALRLYDSNRDTLNTDDTNRAQDLSITRKLPETGTYYVEVDGTFLQTTANYTLDVDRVTPNENDQFAPNDGFSSAAVIPEGFNDARIVGGESDFYQIDANTTDALSLEVININGNDANVALRLYDSDRDTLNTDDTNRAQDLSITRKLPETGTYYVEVDGTFLQTTANYTLDVDRVTPNENDQFAPNDGFSSAAVIPEEFNDARIVGGESDFYQFDANATDGLSLEVININGDDDVALRLYDSDRNTLNTDDTNRAQDLSITRKLPETGTYYVEVDGRFSQTTTDYTLQSNQTGSDSASETSPTVSVGSEDVPVEFTTTENGERTVTADNAVEAINTFIAGDVSADVAVDVINAFIASSS